MTRFVAAMVGLLLFSPVAAWAETGDVVVLLTEIVGEGVDGEEEQSVNFWWSSAETPQWTASDHAVFEGLRDAGVGPMMPNQVNISRIYRRPGLSTANAAQLGALIEGQRVLVGQIEYRSLAPVAPLGYHGVEARAEVEMAAAGASEGVSLQRFTVRRKVYGVGEELLLDEAREITGAALGEMMGRSLRRSSGEIGMREGAETLMAVRNIERASNLEVLRERLLEIEEVDRVLERWASEGIIALEINPGVVMSADISEYVFRVLENHEFDDFRVERSQRTSLGLVEFWVEPREVRF